MLGFDLLQCNQTESTWGIRSTICDYLIAAILNVFVDVCEKGAKTGVLVFGVNTTRIVAADKS